MVFKKNNVKIVKERSFFRVKTKRGRGWQNRGIWLHKSDALKQVKRLMKR